MSDFCFLENMLPKQACPFGVSVDRDARGVMYGVPALPMRAEPKTSILPHLEQFLLHFLFCSSSHFALILLCTFFF